jgi:hypothetical protein
MRELLRLMRNVAVVPFARVLDRTLGPRRPVTKEQPLWLRLLEPRFGLPIRNTLAFAATPVTVKVLFVPPRPGTGGWRKGAAGAPGATLTAIMFGTVFVSVLDGPVTVRLTENVPVAE